jgi:LPS-assembly protein
VIRRTAIVLALLAVARVPAAEQPGPPEPADNLTRPDISVPNGDAEADFSGNLEATSPTVDGVVWRQGSLLVLADRMRYDNRYNVITAVGHVTLTQGESRVLADKLEFHRADGSFTATNVRVEPRYPIIIQGESAYGRGEKITIRQAIVTYTDPGRWKPSIKAREIVYEPGHYLKTVRSAIGLSGMEFVPLGSIRENLNEAISESILSFNVGYRSSLGGIAGLGVHYPVFGNARIGGDASWFTKRGLMYGPSFSYLAPDGAARDSLTSGYIRDQGNHADNLVPQSPGPNDVIPPAPYPLDPRGYDVLNQPIPETRKYLDWQHQQTWDGETWALNGELNYWSDADVYRDFFPKWFYPVEAPDSFVEALYSGANDYAWAFTRFRPNNFEDVQERLPEIGYAVAPVAIGGGFYERMQATAAYLKDIPPLGGPTLSEKRLDAFYGVSRPIAFGPGEATFTPVAGARLTDYLDTQGAQQDGSYLQLQESHLGHRRAAASGHPGSQLPLRAEREPGTGPDSADRPADLHDVPQPDRPRRHPLYRSDRPDQRAADRRRQHPADAG